MSEEIIYLRLGLTDAEWRQVSQALVDADVGEWSGFCDEPAEFSRDESATALLVKLSELIDNQLPEPTA